MHLYNAEYPRLSCRSRSGHEQCEWLDHEPCYLGLGPMSSPDVSDPDNLCAPPVRKASGATWSTHRHWAFRRESRRYSEQEIWKANSVQTSDQESG
jgi:hypothetical protein